MRTLVISLILSSLLWGPTIGTSSDSLLQADRLWRQLLIEADALGLPTTFLKSIPPDFVRFEFDDLQAYAAEYHLGEHRLVLNRSLSFNGAGGALRPLGRLTHREIETLYHELFHAYIDYLVTAAEKDPPKGPAESVLAFAKAQQHCHYSAVLIAPVVQRKMETEERFLSERESWEALNEAWAVFIGWVVWNQLELSKNQQRSIQKPGKSQEEWLNRLKHADQEGALRGYYEPEDTAERNIARKRYLAPASRLSSEEAERLLRDVIGFPVPLVQRARAILADSEKIMGRYGQCR